MAGSVAAFERPPLDPAPREDLVAVLISLVLLSWFHQWLRELNFWYD